MHTAKKNREASKQKTAKKGKWVVFVYFFCFMRTMAIAAIMIVMIAAATAMAASGGKASDGLAGVGVGEGDEEGGMSPVASVLISQAPLKKMPASPPANA